MIPYGRQDISQADIDAVVEVLRSDLLTQGPMVPRFEQAITDYCGARHAVAVNSATSALHLACLSLGVGPGNKVWTSPITFVASANSALYCGAQVDFVDIDPHTCNMSIEHLATKLAQAEVTGTLPRVVIPVHLAGQSCDMAAIFSLAQRYGFRIIEDASHALGGRYAGDPVGNGRYSNITVFSFHPVKNITTGEGGIALTNDSDLARRLALLRSHGITRDRTEMIHEPDGEWSYQQVELGFNYRMTDIQAALGVSQMNRLEEVVAQRHMIAARYDQLLKDLPITTLWQHPDCYSGLHLYVIRLKLHEMRTTHREVFKAMRAAGIGVNLHYIPVYRQPYYGQMGFKPADFPEAERYYAEAISLPMYVGLSERQMYQVVKSLQQAIVT